MLCCLHWSTVAWRLLWVQDELPTGELQQHMSPPFNSLFGSAAVDQ